MFRHCSWRVIDSVVGDIRNVFRLKNEIEGIKNKVIRNIFKKSEMI